MKEDMLQRSIGAVAIGNGSVQFRLWSPEAKEMKLKLDGKEHRLQKDEEGYWSIILPAQEGALYQYSKDGGEYFPDPASLAQPEGVHGPSALVFPEQYAWKDREWKNHKLPDYIIYELHTGTFTSEGNFSSLIEKLDHLVALGITAIEIMPLAQFPGERNWGYDGVFPFAVQDSYGGAAGLQELVDACHAKGLALILDVVYNHLGPEGNYLGAFGPYFTTKYNTPWGGALNFDDAWCDGVRHYFIENALMWFRDFHVDALRLDAVHAIKDLSTKHLLQSIREAVDELMQKTGRQHYLIVESDLNDPRFIDSREERGFGMDAQWIDEFHHALRVTAGGERTGYYEDFNGIEHLAKSYRDAYVYDGQYSSHRKRKFGAPAVNNKGSQFIVFSQNHDQVGNRMLGERSSALFSFEMQKLLAAAVMLSPYLPMLFMGEEWSEPNPFLYFVSHTDPELAEAVRKGRKEEFAAFHAAGEAPDPVAEETFLRSKLQWDLLDVEPHQSMLRYYRDLIAIRKRRPSLHSNKRHQLAVRSEEPGLLFLHRWQEDEHSYCVLNFSGEALTLFLPEDKKWKLAFDSASDLYRGPGSTAGRINGSSVQVYTNSQ